MSMLDIDASVLLLVSLRKETYFLKVTLYKEMSGIF